MCSRFDNTELRWRRLNFAEKVHVPGRVEKFIHTPILETDVSKQDGSRANYQHVTIGNGSVNAGFNFTTISNQ